MDALFLDLAATPVLQALVVAVIAVASEDATTLAAGLLVGAGQMAYPTAVLGLVAGILAGDVGLFALGRLVGPKIRALDLLPPERLDRASRWFERFGVAAILLARCVPGTRLPTYVAAGVLGARVPVFLATAFAGALLWTVAVLYGVSRLGRAVLPELPGLHWVFLVSLLILGLNLLVVRRARRRPATAPATLPVASAEAAS